MNKINVSQKGVCDDFRANLRHQITSDTYSSNLKDRPKIHWRQVDSTNSYRQHDRSTGSHWRQVDSPNSCQQNLPNRDHNTNSYRHDQSTRTHWRQIDSPNSYQQQNRPNRDHLSFNEQKRSNKTYLRKVSSKNSHQMSSTWKDISTTNQKRGTVTTHLQQDRSNETSTDHTQEPLKVIMTLSHENRNYKQ